VNAAELAGLITAVLVVAYNIRNARWWRSARPPFPWV